MKKVFDVKRFILLEQYHMKETRQLLLYVTMAVLMVYLVGSLEILNMPNTGVNGFFVAYILSWLVILAPCVFESIINRGEKMIDFILPASVFEKYIHLLLRYLVIVPATVLVLNQGLNWVLGFISYPLLQQFLIGASLFNHTPASLWGLSIYGALFLLSVFLAKRNSFLWAGGLFIGYPFFLYIAIFLFVVPWKIMVREFDRMPVDINSWGTVVEYSFTMPPQLNTLWIISNINIHLFWWVGILIVCYLLLREKEV